MLAFRAQTAPRPGSCLFLTVALCLLKALCGLLLIVDKLAINFLHGNWYLFCACSSNDRPFKMGWNVWGFTESVQLTFSFSLNRTQ